MDGFLDFDGRQARGRASSVNARVKKCRECGSASGDDRCWFNQDVGNVKAGRLNVSDCRANCLFQAGRPVMEVNPRHSARCTDGSVSTASLVQPIGIVFRLFRAGQDDRELMLFHIVVLGLMIAAVNGSPDFFRMILRTRWCRENTKTASVTSPQRTPQRSVNVGLTGTLTETPSLLFCVFDRVAYVFIGMLGQDYFPRPLSYCTQTCDPANQHECIVWRVCARRGRAEENPPQFPQCGPNGWAWSGTKPRRRLTEAFRESRWALRCLPQRV